MGRKTKRERELEQQCAAFRAERDEADELAEQYRVERDRLARQVEARALASEAGRQQAARLVEEKDEARRLAREWEAKARDAGERLEAVRIEVEPLEDYIAQLDGEVERLRGVIEAIARGEEHVISIPEQDRDEGIWLNFVDRMLGGRFQHQHGWASVLTVADDLLKAHRKRWREDEARSTLEPPTARPLIATGDEITVRIGVAAWQYRVAGFELDSERGITTLDLMPLPLP